MYEVANKRNDTYYVSSDPAYRSRIDLVDQMS